MEIIGQRPHSGFRVHEDYFNDKRGKFAPGVDPTTGGPILIVYDKTDDVVPGVHMYIGDPDNPKTGKIVPDDEIGATPE